MDSPQNRPKDSPLTSKTTIFDIASKILECIAQAEKKYFSKDSISQSKFSQIGLLSNSQDIWEYPIQPRENASVNPVRFLKIFKDVLIKESENVPKVTADYCEIAVCLVGMEKTSLKIFHKLENHNKTFSLKIKSQVHGVLKVLFKQMPSFSERKMIQKELEDKNTSLSSLENLE